MTLDQIENQIRGTRRETDHGFASVMAIKLDDPVRRQRQLRHDLAIGMSGGAFSRRQQIDDADTCPDFGQMESRGASGDAGAHDDAVVAAIWLELRECSGRHRRFGPQRPEPRRALQVRFVGHDRLTRQRGRIGRRSIARPCQAIKTGRKSV